MKPRIFLGLIVILLVLFNFTPAIGQLNCSGGLLGCLTGLTASAVLVTDASGNASASTTIPSGLTIGSGGSTVNLGLAARGFVGFDSSAGNVALQGIAAKGVEFCVGNTFAAGTCYVVMNSTGGMKMSGLATASGSEVDNLCLDGSSNVIADTAACIAFEQAYPKEAAEIKSQRREIEELRNAIAEIRSHLN